jgi:predicted AAA+ superfamily ATPase
MTLIGRLRERDLLQSCLDSPEAEFVAVYGRRRVGKTYLVRQFFGDSFAFYATGLARGTMRDQLTVFHQALLRYGSKKDLPRPTTWLMAFQQLVDLLDQVPCSGKHVVFLDELPWFDTQRSGVVTALEYFWNGYASARDDVILITCGSAASWMINKLIRDHGGLHNRVTVPIHIKPFTLSESAEYLAMRGVVMNRYQLVEAQMIFGGVPFYLRHFDRRLGLTQNVDRLCFEQNAVLRDEFETMFRSLFRHSERHRRIVESLAAKPSGYYRDELAAASKTPQGGMLTRVLKELEESGFIRITLPFGANRKGKKYQLSDAFSLFHLTFLTESPDPSFWTRFSMTPRHNAWAGLAFEQTCVAHLPQIKRALGISGVATRQSGWRITRTTDHPGAQIDLVIDRADGVVNLCEMKYTTGDFALTSASARALREQRELFRAETMTKSALHLTLVTPYGLIRNEWFDTFQQVLTAEDLFDSPLSMSFD